MNQELGRRAAADDARGASDSWHEWQIDGRKRRIVLCVETALELRPGYPDFDPARLEALIAEATELAHASASPIDLIRIVPAR